MWGCTFAVTWLCLQYLAWSTCALTLPLVQPPKISQQQILGPERQRDPSGRGAWQDDSKKDWYHFLNPFAATTPLRNWDNLLWLTTASLGTPRQDFTLVVDIAWTDLFVPSSQCTQRGCQELHSTYNSSASSTYANTNKTVQIHYAGLYTSGDVTSESFTIAGVTIQNQQFEEATEIRAVPRYWDDVYDGVLGLAPIAEGQQQNLLHPLSMMVSQELLKRKLFTLALPLEGNGDGALTLGNVDHDMYTSDLSYVPLTSEVDHYLATKWTVRASSVSLESSTNRSTLLNASVAGTAAFFETAYPFIDLPRTISLEFAKTIGANSRHTAPFFSVPCAKRETLPSLVLKLGERDTKEIRLSAYQYTSEGAGWDGYCILLLSSHAEHEDETPYLRLGAAFLRGRYTVFDMEMNKIGFADAK